LFDEHPDCRLLAVAELLFAPFGSHLSEVGIHVRVRQRVGQKPELRNIRLAIAPRSEQIFRVQIAPLIPSGARASLAGPGVNVVKLPLAVDSPLLNLAALGFARMNKHFLSASLEPRPAKPRLNLPFADLDFALMPALDALGQNFGHQIRAIQKYALVFDFPLLLNRFNLIEARDSLPRQFASFTAQGN